MNRKNIIINLYRQGNTYSQIGIIFGISRQRIHQIIRNISSRGYQGERILRRDNYQCQFCFNNKKLEIHHLDQNRKNNKDTNLLVLCQECHRKLHAKLLF